MRFSPVSPKYLANSYTALPLAGFEAGRNRGINRGAQRMWVRTSVPTLKRWAIVGCPSGTRTWPGRASEFGVKSSGIGRAVPHPLHELALAVFSVNG